MNPPPPMGSIMPSIAEQSTAECPHCKQRMPLTPLDVARDHVDQMIRSGRTVDELMVAIGRRWLSRYTRNTVIDAYAVVYAGLAGTE